MPDYKIHGYEFREGQIIFDVEHFDSNSNSIGKQYYTFQGRVGHRTSGLSWESVIQVIEDIHPRMISGEILPDLNPPRVSTGKPYDFTGIDKQKTRGQLNKLKGLSRDLGQGKPTGFTDSASNVSPGHGDEA